ncbi:transposase [Planococcus lenghuensis]|uniref:transposase n=1 Tax=Planococcus lenghuensis TaxID=2213202 RepID=UPI001E58BCA1|nr:transposase [Planococcus lenghuensis]
MCDLESRQPIALLPDRLPETITTWLKTRPEVLLVSRDGFTAFRQGITEANRSILQVYDRWHFICNAKKQLDLLLLPLIPSVISWSLPCESSAEVPVNLSEKRAKDRQKQKWELILEIQEAYKKGKRISRLAREYELNWRTVQKYIRMTSPPSASRVRRRPTDKYQSLIQRLETEGKTVKEIYQCLQEQGYAGTYSAVRTVVETLRKKRNLRFSEEEAVRFSRRQVSAYLWRPAAELTAEEVGLLRKIFQLYPAIEPLYQLVQEYRRVIQARDYDGFLKWLTAQLSSRDQPFYQYARRLRSDLQAVKHGLLLSYSNGLLEGQINRLKMIKRMTYGRAHLHLLEKRVLYRL